MIKLHLPFSFVSRLTTWMPKSESRQHARRHYSAGLKPITRLLAWTPLHASRTAIPVLMPVYRPLSIGRRSRVNIPMSTTNAKDYIIDPYLPANSNLIARVDSLPIHPFCLLFFPFFFFLPLLCFFLLFRLHSPSTFFQFLLFILFYFPSRFVVNLSRNGYRWEY